MSLKASSPLPPSACLTSKATTFSRSGLKTLGLLSPWLFLPGRPPGPLGPTLPGALGLVTMTGWPGRLMRAPGTIDFFWTLGAAGAAAALSGFLATGALPLTGAGGALAAGLVGAGAGALSDFLALEALIGAAFLAALSPCEESAVGVVTLPNLLTTFLIVLSTDFALEVKPPSGWSGFLANLDDTVAAASFRGGCWVGGVGVAPRAAVLDRSFFDCGLAFVNLSLLLDASLV